MGHIRYASSQMDMLKLGLIVLYNLGIIVFAKAPESLRFVHAVWRHGDRSASRTFPSDTKNGEDSWPQGFGELSQEGMRQHFALGQYLRKRYSGFLKPSYWKYEIFVKSTSYNRTIMSALANMAGMYPPEGDQIWNSTIFWQPIPVHSQPRETDPMLWMEANCPVEDKLYDSLMKSKQVVKIVEENKEFIDFLREKTGLKDNLNRLDDMWHVYDPLNAEMYHNDTHKWPDWVTPKVFEKVKRLYDLSTKFYYYTPEIQRFRGGLLLGDIVSRMENKRSNNSDLLDSRLKYFVYSAHDTTVNALLSILGAYNGINPPYASVVLLELHERKEKWEVEVWYRNVSTEEPHSLTVSGCSGSPCSLDEFVGRSRSLVPSDWHKQCGLGPETSQGTWQIIVGSLVAFCTLLLIALIFVTLQWIHLRRGTGYSLTENVDA